MGGQNGVVADLNASFFTLPQAYNLTYPDEEYERDKAQFPFLGRMLYLVSMLHDITRLKHRVDCCAEIAKLRQDLDDHRDAIQSLQKAHNFQPRTRATFFVLSALYNTVEISFSRALGPSQSRHSASAFAIEIIRLSQKLNTLYKTHFKGSPSSPPPTKIWPLPLVMAAIEVDDDVYREWVIDRLKMYEQTGGDHYTRARRFVEVVYEKESQAESRLDWEQIMIEFNDGLVI